MLQAVEKARSGGDVAKTLLFVERMLVEQGMLQPKWEQQFQGPWRKSLARCSDSRQAILYLAAVQVPQMSTLDIMASKPAFVYGMLHPALERNSSMPKLCVCMALCIGRSCNWPLT